MVIDKIPEPQEMSDERYFYIRDVDRNGHGSFGMFCVDSKTTNDEIGKIAADVWTKKKLEKERIYMPSLFKKPSKWRNVINVVEQERKIRKLDKINERTGKEYENSWMTKRGGFKFKIHNNYIKMVLHDGTVYVGNGYSS